MLRTLKVSTTVATLFAVGGCTAVLGISSDPHTQTASTSEDGGNTQDAAGSDGGSDGTAPDAGPPTCTGTLYVRIASDFSGTATDIAVPHFWGLYDRLRQVNKDGGILGCPLDLDVKDDGYTGPVTLAAVSDWRQKDLHWGDVNTLFIFGTGPTTSAGPQLMQEKKVIIPGSYAGAFDTPAPVSLSVNYDKVDPSTFIPGPSSEPKASPGWPYVFYPATDYGTAIRLAIAAAAKIQPGRMAFAADYRPAPSACAFCTDPLAAGKSYIGNANGMSIGRDLQIPQTSDPNDAVNGGPAVLKNTTDYFTAEITHFKAVNTTTATDPYYDPVVWVWSGNSVFASAIVGKAVAAVQAQIDADLDIKAILDAHTKKWKIRVMANNWGIGETTPTICGAACNNDIMYGLFPVPRFGDIQASTAMGELLAARDTWAQQDVTTPPLAFSTAHTGRAFTDFKDVRYVQGYAAAVMWETAVKAAIAAGSKNPTGEEIKNALEKFNKQDISGLTAGPLTFTTADHRPQSNEVIYKIDSNGTLALVDHYSIDLVDQWLGY